MRCQFSWRRSGHLPGEGSLNEGDGFGENFLEGDGVDRVAVLSGLQGAMKFRRGLMRPAGLDGGTPVGGREKREGRASDRDGEMVWPGVAGEKGERVRLDFRETGER